MFKYLSIILLVSLSAFSADLFDLYGEAKKAHHEANYNQFLANRQNSGAYLEAELIEILEDLKKNSDSKSRQNVFVPIVSYPSTKHNSFKERALNVLAGSDYSIDQLVSGNYDSKNLAKLMLENVRNYEREVVIPILLQAEFQIRLLHPGRIIFSIGRDFSRANIFFSQRQVLNNNTLVTANVSRKVRDAALSGGEGPALNSYLASIGVTAKDIAKKGIVFMDSSMSGKIPRGIIQSIAQGLSAADKYKVLRNTYFMYLNTSRKVGVYSSERATKYSFAEYVEEAAQGTNEVNDSVFAHLISYFSTVVPRFDIVLPASHVEWPFKHHHNLLEHTYKALQSSEGLSGKKGQGRITVPDLQNSESEKIEFILGLSSELELFENAPKASLDSEINFIENGIYFRETKKEVEGRAQNGYKYLSQWQYTELPGTVEAIRDTEIKKVNGVKYLMVNGKAVLALGPKIGEGRNLEVYLLGSGLAIKIIKEAKQARKNLMLAWMGDRMRSYGMSHSPVRYVHPSGHWLIQDVENVVDLEAQYRDILMEKGVQGVPKEIRKQILTEWKKALALATKENIWLDFKAANFVINSEGKIVNIDYVPRINKGHKTYFFDKETGEQFSEERVLKEFLMHDIEKGKSFENQTAGVKVPVEVREFNREVLRIMHIDEGRLDGSCKASAN